MGSVFRKVVTRAMPEGAEVFTRKGQQYARWKDSGGRTRTARVTESGRVATESSTYVMQYRDGSGIIRTESTGCRDKGAAQARLAEQMQRAEKVRGGIISAAEDTVADHRVLPIATHFKAYTDHLTATGATDGHVQNVKRYLTDMAQECGFDTLAAIDRAAFERRLLNARKSGISATARKNEKGVSARSQNAIRAAWVAFMNWCVTNRRLVSNPLVGIAKQNEGADPRRQRRALTEDEMLRLLEVARTRPLNEALLIRRGKNKGKLLAAVADDVRQERERLGRERALMYKMLLLTGLRKSELASLTVAHLVLDGANPHAVLEAADAKNRQAARIPLRADMVTDLREWVADLLSWRRIDSVKRGEPVAARLEPTTPVFNVPAALHKILDRDLKAAEIPKRDDRGRTVDVHAMRTTFGTHLSKGNVPLRTAQAALRHSTPTLTAGVYTDTKLLDVAGALDALPDLPLGGCNPVAVTVAVGSGFEGDSGAKFGAQGGKENRTLTTEQIRKNAHNCGIFQPVSPDAVEIKMVEMNGIEPSTSCLPDNGAGIATGRQDNDLQTAHNSGCSTRCSELPNPVHADPLQALADTLLNLPESDRQRLAALLAGKGGK